MLPVIEGRGIQIDLFKQFQQGFAPASSFSGKEDATGIRMHKLLDGGEGHCRPRIARQFRQDFARETHRLRMRFEFHLSVGFEPAEQFVYRDENLLRGQDRAISVEPSVLVAVRNVCPELFAGLSEITCFADRGVIGQKIEQ